jgi:PKHD-type hydroxylase
MSNYNRIFGLEGQEKDKDLLSYYWFEGILSPAKCEEIIKIGKRFRKETATTFSDSHNEARNSEVRWIPPNEDTKFIFDQIRECCEEANRNLFKLDTTGFTEDLQFTEYEGQGKHYDWHPDIGPGKNKRKLSVVIQLSDPKDYTGGNLILNTGNEITMDRGRGNIIIFPSFLLHKVSRMESGNRYSIVSWISGNPWR